MPTLSLCSHQFVQTYFLAHPDVIIAAVCCDLNVCAGCAV
jgi:hypothetical protein